MDSPPELPLQLPAELCIDAVQALRTQWLHALEAAPAVPLEVGAAAVMQVDAAGLQLLLALHKSLGRRGRSLRLRAPSAALRTACLDLGLHMLLDSPPSAGASA